MQDGRVTVESSDKMWSTGGGNEKPLRCSYHKTPQTVWLGRTDAEAPVLWPPDVKIWLTGKDPDAGKDWRQKETGTTEDEMISITDSMDVKLERFWELAEDRGA